ncbi:MAG: hypothetical protein ACI93T_003859, partial [Porticoccaceae bacterium]
ESLDNDDISATDVIGPQASGISISSARFELSTSGSVTPGLGVSPATQVIPVVYDIDDDDRIGFGDLSYFADAFSDSVVTTDSLQTWALDFDRSGSIGFGDLAFLADNFGVTTATSDTLHYPDAFLSRTSGAELVTDGATSVDSVLEAAIAAWSEALGEYEVPAIQLVITDLPGSQIGEASILAVDANGLPSVSRIVLDIDAAGRGWHTDPLTAPASDRFDLYTVLLHEAGHALGFTQSFAGFAALLDGSSVEIVGSTVAQLDGSLDHLDSTIHLNDLMAATLGTGIRRDISDLDISILTASYDAVSPGQIDLYVTSTKLNADPEESASLETDDAFSDWLVPLE